MQHNSILIAGCGDVGSALARLLLAQGHKVTGLRRNINQLPQGIQGLSADLGQLASLKAALQTQTQCDILVYSAAASSHTETGYRAAYVEGLENLLKALPCRPKHLFFTSSSGVYHQNDDSWVDENSPCQPERFSGQIMLDAEQRVIHSEIPGTVVRFSGIYGPGRNHLINKVRSGEVTAQSPTLYSNRIHRDDCAGVLNHLIGKALRRETLDNCYLASDDCPATLHEVSHWLAEQLNAEIKTETISRRSGSKRCSNQRLKDSGYQFIYPSYREGYTALLQVD